MVVVGILVENVQVKDLERVEKEKHRAKVYKGKARMARGKEKAKVKMEVAVGRDLDQEAKGKEKERAKAHTKMNCVGIAIRPGIKRMSVQQQKKVKSGICAA